MSYYVSNYVLNPNILESSTITLLIQVSSFNAMLNCSSPPSPLQNHILAYEVVAGYNMIFQDINLREFATNVILFMLLE